MQGKMIYGVGGLIIGLVAGFFAANSLNRQSAVTASSTSVVNPTDGAASSGNAQQPGGMQFDVARTLEKAEAEPNNFVAQMQAGDMYAQIGRFEKAIEFYLKGVALDPQSAPANIVLANAYFDSQKFEDAEKYYAKALEIDPKNVNARTDLGATFVERQPPDYERGISEFRKALELDPRNAAALYYLGVALHRKGERVQAENTLTELEKVSPQSELAIRLRQYLNAKPTIR
jgi:tetratricopeptide (TPR) repeat protein